MHIEEHESNKGLKGFWLIEAFDQHGSKVDEISGYNLITNVGKNLILDLLAGINGAVKLTGMAVGTSGTAATVNDTAITTPQFKAFDAAPTRSGQTTTYITTYGTAEANINIQELGLLTASGGVLFNRIVVGPFNKTSAVSIRITVQLTQA